MDTSLLLYTTPDEQELLQLIAYFINKIELRGAQRSGFIDKDKEEIKALKAFETWVEDVARGRRDMQQADMDDAAELLRSRTHFDCEKCGQESDMELLGETTNSKFGWKLDRVRCKSCHKTYVHFMPNNDADRTAFQNNLIEQLFTIREDGQTIAEKLDVGGGDEPMQKLVDTYKQARKKTASAKEARKALEKSHGELSNALVEIRNMLLLAKLKGTNWSVPPAVA